MRKRLVTSSRRTPAPDVPGLVGGRSGSIGPATTVRRTRATRCLVVAMLCCALVLAGCKSGTITGSQHACKSTGGLFASKSVACTGSVAGVQGQPSLGIIDTDQDLSGNYKLDATITVGTGEAKAYVSTASGGQAGGKISPGEPLRISGIVGLDEDDDEVSVNLKVLGKEVKDLRHEATLLPQDWRRLLCRVP